LTVKELIENYLPSIVRNTFCYGVEEPWFTIYMFA